MRSKCFYPIREAFPLHAFRLRAAALQADCVGVTKAYLGRKKEL